MGRNVPNLSHLPENVHKRFCAHPAEKQDALFCCSVNFHHWRYGFESLPPAAMDKTATISEEHSGEGDLFSPAVYYRFPKDFEMKEGISHEHHYRHRPRLLRHQNSPLLVPGRTDKLRRTRTLHPPRTLRVWRVLFCLWLRAAAKDYIYKNQYSAVSESRRLDGSKAWDGYYLSYAKGYLCDEVNHYKTLTYADESTYHIHAEQESQDEVLKSGFSLQKLVSTTGQPSPALKLEGAGFTVYRISKLSKDATKVDRSGAYMARYIAKNMVTAHLADRCQVTLAYAIGQAEPVMVDVNTFGTCKACEDDCLAAAVRKAYDLTPAGIIRQLNLTNPIYKYTAAGGHFGRDGFPWEKVDNMSDFM